MKKLIVSVDHAMPVEKLDAFKEKLAADLEVDPCCILVLPEWATLVSVDLADAPKAKPKPHEPKHEAKHAAHETDKK